MNKATTISAGALAVVMLGMATFPLANAAPIDDEIRVSNYESVSGSLDATGALQSAVIVDHLTILGNGEVAISNPVADGDQRNLSTFQAIAGENGVVETTVNVRGSQELRTLSDYQGDLPVSLSATYYLDGEVVDPDELTKATGQLRVEYTVTNETGEVETITYTDAAGQTVTKDVMIYTPLAGSFSTVLPAAFSNVSSPEAAVAADGRGNTKVQWSLTLLPPLSSPSATFGYTADIVNGSIPESNLSMIPVKPMDNPTAAGAVSSYESGAQSGRDLYAGGEKLDDGLLQLADGAGQLLAGLAKLHAGSGQLSDGLDKADGGAQALAEGAAKVDGGAQQLSAGSGQLSGGLQQLAAGFETLEEQQAFQQIIGGLVQISAGVGDPNSWATDAQGNPADLNSALNHLRAGLDGQIIPGLQQMKAGAETSKSDLAPLVAASPGAVAGAEQLLGLTSTADTVTINTVNGPVTIPAEQLTQLLGYTVHAGGAMQQVDGALAQSIAGYGQLIAGTQRVSAGLVGVQDGVNGIGTGAGTIKAGVQAVFAAVAGDMANGVRDLSSGADRLDAGMTELASGTGQLAAGSAELASGTGQLAAGAQQLEDGLGQATEAGPAMADGIDRLRTEGAQQISASGMDTQLKYEEYVAQVAQAAQRTEDGALPAGAPENAEVARAAYSLDVAGTPEQGIGPVAQVLIAAGLFGAAGAGLALRSRRSR